MPAVAAVALAVGAVIAVPTAAQAAPSCLFSLGKTAWITQIHNDTCELVQSRSTEYNNYGLVGTYTGPQTVGTSSSYAPESAAPGTYVSHSYRYKPNGKSWSAWLPY